MSNMTPMLWEPSLASSQDLVEICLPFILTNGAVQNTAAFLGRSSPRILVEGGSAGVTDITQAAVDALLGSTNEVIVATAFGSTAMAADNTYCWVLDCSGQIAEVLDVKVLVNVAGTVGKSMGIGTTTALTDAGFTLSQVYLTSAGNLAGRITYTDIDAMATDGAMYWHIQARIK